MNKIQTYFMWAQRDPFWLKVLPQTGHTYLTNSLWIFSWMARLDLVLNRFEHSVHWYGLFSVWTSWWRRNNWRCLNVFSHLIQANLRQYSLKLVQETNSITRRDSLYYQDSNINRVKMFTYHTGKLLIYDICCEWNKC